MMDASKTYTNDTLTTSRKPAAKSLFISTPPPGRPKTQHFEHITVD